MVLHEPDLGASPLTVRTAWRTTREAEHTVLGLTSSPEPTWLATHFVAGVVAVTAGDGAAVEVLGAGVPDEDARRIREEHRSRSAGRLFAFPGSAQLTGVLTVRDLLRDSAIDAVTMVGHREPVDPETRLDTQDFVRPTMSDGRVELVVRPAAGGLVVPFEQPHPTPCCADHA